MVALDAATRFPKKSVGQSERRVASRELNGLSRNQYLMIKARANGKTDLKTFASIMVEHHGRSFEEQAVYGNLLDSLRTKAKNKARIAGRATKANLQALGVTRVGWSASMTDGWHTSPGAVPQARGRRR